MKIWCILGEVSLLKNTVTLVKHGVGAMMLRGCLSIISGTKNVAIAGQMWFNAEYIDLEFVAWTMTALLTEKWRKTLIHGYFCLTSKIIMWQSNHSHQ